MTGVTIAPTSLLPLKTRTLMTAILMMLMPMLAACGFNTIPTNEEKAKAAWSEVLNQYQRRTDLIPNLVETVKGYATHEQDIFRPQPSGVTVHC